jgi:hypothetical protein
VEFCGGRSGAAVGFLRVLRFPLPIFIPPIAPKIILIYHRLSYANVVRGNANQEPLIEENSTMLSKFLEEFKAMFQQLVQQNSMVLNMLTTLISKIH